MKGDDGQKGVSTFKKKKNRITIPQLGVVRRDRSSRQGGVGKPGEGGLRNEGGSVNGGNFRKNRRAREGT